ncbi:MAG TPA: putative toxin-antitoxin system toxin component, PIN family [Chloroflexota bacterium]|nr:putative toxin-antitoxin system toxin component, PIN family [Chloroflexota bacterium]
MTRAVFDTNTLASGFVTAGGVGDQLLQRWLMGHFELVISEEIINELIAVFAKPYFRDRMSDQQAAENVALLRRRAVVAVITVQLSDVATHPADDVILSLAVSSQVDYLVTGDRRFRKKVGTYEGVTLITPRNFLTVLDAGPEGSRS